MKRKLLGVYESEKAIVRIYTGPMTDTPEKQRTLLGPAVINFAEAIYKRNHEHFKRIAKTGNNDE